MAVTKTFGYTEAKAVLDAEKDRVTAALRALEAIRARESSELVDLIAKVKAIPGCEKYAG